MEMRAEPCELTEVSSVTPAISPRRRSSGAAIVAAIVSGSAPGRLACTRSVGKSTVGQARDRQIEVGGSADQEQPGRQQRRSDRPQDEGGREAHGSTPRPTRPLRWRHRRLAAGARADEPRLQALHRQVDDGRGVEREQLAQEQAADDGDAERIAQLRAGARLQRQRQRAEQRGERRHHDGAEAQKRGLDDRTRGASARARAPLPARSRSS